MIDVIRNPHYDKHQLTMQKDKDKSYLEKYRKYDWKSVIRNPDFDRYEMAYCRVLARNKLFLNSWNIY